VEGEPAQLVEINELLTSLADRHARAGRNVELNLSSDYKVPMRPMAMHRLIGNLIDNAFAYGKGRVTVTTKITAGYMVISVLDNGPGIPAAHMTRLLRPFERMDSARGNEGGSGLGLAIADRIAKLHKGKLELFNRPQGGLEARLSLPL
jgi:two-component system osmolarity sensor histidine kinase EnvZ